MEKTKKMFRDGGKRTFLDKNDFIEALNNFLTASEWQEVSSSLLVPEVLSTGLFEEPEDITIPANVAGIDVADIIDELSDLRADEFNITVGTGGDDKCLVAESGVISLVERMGALSPAFGNLTDDQKIHQMITNGKAFNKPVKLRFQVGKLRAALSSDYVVLDQADLVSEMLYFMNKYEHEFKFAQITHDLTYFRTLITDDEFSKGFDDALGVEETDVYLSFKTSDTGHSAATVNLVLMAKPKPDIETHFEVVLPEVVRVEHKGDVSIDTFEEKLQELDSKAENYKDRLHDMKSEDVTYPKNTLWNIMSNIGVSVRAKNELIEHVDEDVDLSRMDVYVLASQAISLMEEHGITENSIASARYRLSKVISPDFKWGNYDIAVAIGKEND